MSFVKYLIFCCESTKTIWRFTSKSKVKICYCNTLDHETNNFRISAKKIYGHVKLIMIVFCKVEIYNIDYCSQNNSLNIICSHWETYRLFEKRVCICSLVSAKFNFFLNLILFSIQTMTCSQKRQVEKFKQIQKHTNVKITLPTLFFQLCLCQQLFIDKLFYRNRTQ